MFKISILLTITVFSFLPSYYLKGQDSIFFSVKKFSFFFNDSTKAIIDSVFLNSKKTLPIIYSNKYTPLNYHDFGNSMTRDKYQKIFVDWRKIMIEHKLEIIDSNKTIEPEIKKDTFLVAFLSYPYKEYIICEIFATTKHIGYESSSIIMGKRLQILFKRLPTGEFVIINKRVIFKVNKLKFID